MIFNNALYVFGVGGSSDYVLSLDVTNAKTENVKKRKWVQLASIPDVPFKPLPVAYGQSIFLFDGGAGGDCIKEAQMYNPHLDHWTMISPMPLACSGGAAVLLNETIYVFGGEVQCAMAYCPVNDQWRVLSPPSNRFIDASAVAWQGKLLVNGNGCFEEYDPQTDSWTQKPEFALKGKALMLATFTEIPRG